MTDIQLSDAEVKSITHGIEANVRADGRTRIQHRPLNIELNPVAHACGSSQVSFATGGDGEGTRVLVSIMAEIVEVADSSIEQGSMEIHLDCVPTVTMMYGKIYSGGVSLRSSMGATNKGKLAFLTHSTMALSRAFGAKVSLSGSTLNAGIETDLAAADGENAAIADEDENAAAPSTPVADRACSSFYKDLYLGHGFAYELHADVNILQGGGGGLLTAASAGIIAALKCMQLPRAEITVHPDGTASVEVNPKQVRLGAPIRLHEIPLLMTASLHNGRYAVDPSLLETIAIPALLTVGSTAHKVITSVSQFAQTGRRSIADGSVIATGEDLIAALTDITHVVAEVFESIDSTVQEASERTDASYSRKTAVSAIKK